MQSSAKDKVQGAFHEAKGKIREIAGILANEPDLELAGAAEKNIGKLQMKLARIKAVLGK